MSENVSSAIATNGEIVTKQPLIKSMRTVKKETLKLISGWVSRSNEPQMVSEHRIALQLYCNRIHVHNVKPCLLCTDSRIQQITRVYFTGCRKLRPTVVGCCSSRLSEKRTSCKGTRGSGYHGNHCE